MGFINVEEFDTKKQVDELRACAKDLVGELADIVNGAADTIELIRSPVVTVNDPNNKLHFSKRMQILNYVSCPHHQPVVEYVEPTEENKIILEYSPLIDEKISINSANDKLEIDKRYNLKDFVINDNVITIGGPALDDKCKLFIVTYEYQAEKAFNILLNNMEEEPGEIINTAAADLERALDYIDNCDEDQWQEFCACLEHRGWLVHKEPSMEWIPVSVQMPLPCADVWVSSDLGQMSAWYDNRWKVWRASHNHDLELIVRAWHDLQDDYEGEVV